MGQLLDSMLRQVWFLSLLSKQLHKATKDKKDLTSEVNLTNLDLVLLYFIRFMYTYHESASDPDNFVPHFHVVPLGGVQEHDSLALLHH